MSNSKFDELLRIRLHKLVGRSLLLIGLFSLCALSARAQDAVPAPPPAPACVKTVTAQVVAFDQIIFYNRFGSFDPGGMIFALKRDAVPIE
ncbi:MAG TPA: hypothetical protein VN937_27810, partial [Blastocatellia bacterium]|nr:hypothetical protein [Blastocatellia bacterium]